MAEVIKTNQLAGSVTLVATRDKILLTHTSGVQRPASNQMSMFTPLADQGVLYDWETLLSVAPASCGPQ